MWYNIESGISKLSQNVTTCFSYCVTIEFSCFLSTRNYKKIHNKISKIKSRVIKKLKNYYKVNEQRAKPLLEDLKIIKNKRLFVKYFSSLIFK